MVSRHEQQQFDAFLNSKVFHQRYRKRFALYQLGDECCALEIRPNLKQMNYFRLNTFFQRFVFYKLSSCFQRIDYLHFLIQGITIRITEPNEKHTWDNFSFLYFQKIFCLKTNFKRKPWAQDLDYYFSFFITDNATITFNDSINFIIP